MSMRAARPRHFLGHPVPEDGIGDRFLLCFLIAGGTGIFLWAYGAIAQRDPFTVPILHAPAVVRAGYDYSAPAPDMHSAAIRFSNSDVVSPQQTRASEPKTAQAETPRQRNDTSHVRNDTSHTAKRRLPPEAANAYASGSQSAPKSAFSYPKRDFGAPE